MPLTIFRRKGKDGKPKGSWIIRGTVAGQSVYESTGLIDKRAAQIKKTRLEAQLIERASLGKSATLTFAEAALTYLESGGEARFVSPLLLHFGESKRLVDIDNDDLNKAARTIYPAASDSTINRQLITPMSAIYNMAADEGHVPAKRFRRRKEPAGRLRWLTPEEAESLLYHSDPHLLPIIAFLLGSGCRVSEALNLDESNLHLESRQAFIPHTKNGELKMVEFPLRTKRIMASAQLPQAGRVFRTPKGDPYETGTGSGGQIAVAFTKARKGARLGDDVTPHSLRHTFATWHYAMNKDLVSLMARGGWKDPKMAMRYTKLAPADLRERLQQFGWDFRAKSVHDDFHAEGFGNKIMVIK